MAVSDEVRRIVFERDRNECQLWHKEPYRENLTYCHVTHQGMGGDSSDSPINQPENGFVACQECHNRLHASGSRYYRIVHFDPNDPEQGLVIVSHRNKIVSSTDLWFYVRHWYDQVPALWAAAQTAMDVHRKALWAIGQTLYFLYESQMTTALDDRDLFFLAARDLKLSSQEVKELIRLVRWAIENRVVEKAETLPIGMVAVARRYKDPNILNVATSEHPADFWDWVRRMYRRSRKTVAWIGSGKLRRVDVAGQDALPEPGDNEFIIRGGSLIRGIHADEEPPMQP